MKFIDRLRSRGLLFAGAFAIACAAYYLISFTFSNGKVKVYDPIDVKVVDKYDYHLVWRFRRLEDVGGLASLLNNVAYLDNQTGVIHTYFNWIMFREYYAGKWSVK